MKLLVLISVLSLASTATIERTPSFSLITDRSTNDGSPIVEVTFPNGHSDTMVLSQFVDGIDEPQPESRDCRYNGYLLSDPEACLAMTGCPGLEDVELTILSEHAPGSGMFIWHKNGMVENLEHPEHSEHSRQATSNDVQFTPAIAAAESKAQNACSSGKCKAVPAKMNLSVRVR